MTKQAKQIKEDMIADFLHWARYNPTVVKQKYGVSSLHLLEEIIRLNIVKNYERMATRR